MNRSDYALSFSLHLLLMISVLVLSNYSPRVDTNFDDVIKIDLRSFSMPPPIIQEPIKEEIPLIAPTVPKAVEAEDDVEYVQDPTTITDEAEIAQKPVEEPVKEEPKDKPYQKEADSGDETTAGTNDGTADISEAVRGSKFGGASVDNASFDYPYWFDVAFRKIERNWTFAGYTTQTITCTIYFQVISSGRIIKIEIENSSGNSSFDRACKRALERSKPLPPLPPEYADELLGVHLVFPYSPR